MEKRLSPEEWLEGLKQEEKNQKGKLKIFFGYAAGVGKTYAMLVAAQELRKAGIDVAVGYIEPHARQETLALLTDLEQLPPKEVLYKQLVLKEFDLDGALLRRPQVLLVDELAHTNAPGCRHSKRYQDILELLEAGINVYTTVNVQHLESLNDVIADITNVMVQERLPDGIFDEAEQVEMIDIEPEELLERLNEDKIYTRQQAQQAQENFFTKENLTALREIAMRRLANRINERNENDTGLSRKRPSVDEHILICLSAAPSNSKVIRAAARIAGAFHGSFTALYVEKSEEKTVSAKDQKRLHEHIALAEQLGAQVVTIYGQDLAKAITDYATVAGISKVVLGRSNHKRILGYKLNNLTDKIIRLAPELDLYIIPDNQPLYHKRVADRMLFANQLNYKNNGILFMLLLVAVLLGRLIEYGGFSQSSVIMVFILGAFLTAFWTGSRLYSVMASLMHILAFNFFFTQPRYTFWIHDTNSVITCMVLLITTLLTSTMTWKIKEQGKMAAQQAKRTAVLLETSQKLQRATGMNEIADAACGQFMQLLECPIVLYLVDNKKIIATQSHCYQQESPDEMLVTQGQEIAAWVAQHGQRAGSSTDTLGGAMGLYLPIMSHQNVLAVLGIPMTHKKQLQPLERDLLAAMLNETGFALEKNRLNEQQQRILLEADRERLRANLLRAISHDLRTPLTSISGNADMLLHGGGHKDSELTHKLLEDIYTDAVWLIDLVENLLSLTRLDNGTMALHMTPELISDVVNEAMNHINRTQGHHLTIQIEDQWLMAHMDAQLIIQVMVNLMNNAIKYTHEGAHISLCVQQRDEMAIIEVKDDGEGIDDGHKDKLFDMFFTIDPNKGDSRRGLGLGLALCQSIVNAHHGKMFVRDNVPKGAIVGFTLPIKEVLIDEDPHFNY